MPYFFYNQFQIGPITFYSWGFFLGLAFFASYFLFLKEAKKHKITEGKIFWLVFIIIIGSILGSRFAYVLQFSSYYFSNPSEIFQFNAGGLMLYGGLIGAIIAGWLYFKLSRFEIGFLRLVDLSAPAIALGIFIGRIGCFLINDHQGALTGLPWAIKWFDDSLRHPVAGYLAINGLVMFLVLWNLRNKLQRPGQLFIIFLFWYGISRFLLDFTRAADPSFAGLFISQWISLFILAAAIILQFYIVRVSKPE